MRYILFFILIHGIGPACTMAQAQECYLSIDENGTQFVDCRIGAVPPNYKRICPAVSGEKDASLYKIEVYKDELSLVEKALEFVGIQSEKVKDWDGSPLEQGEFIKCSIDATKVSAKEAARVAVEAAEKAKKDKETSDWASACAGAKAGSVEGLLCKERGF